MYPRVRIDIGWRDLAWTVGQCIWAAQDAPLPLTTQAASEAIVTLSVRSAFDLLLSALHLPKGSEVLLSEITVPHMERIVREHGLTPVAVPVDARTLQVDAATVLQRMTFHTKVVVVAHLFGARAQLDELGQLCRARDVVLVEDCAQALTSGLPERDPAADVSLFSLGPVKTATALGGGIALIADSTLREAMRRRASDWPRQANVSYLFRIAKFSGLKLLSTHMGFTLLVRIINAGGGDADAFVGHSARGFSDDRLFANLRQQPCAALTCLIARRLAHFGNSQLAERTDRGQKLAEAIEPAAFAAGCDNATHTYWVFPLVCDEPLRVVRALRAAGFDASQISGLRVIGETQPDHWFGRTVFVPHGLHVPREEVMRAAEVIQSSVATCLLPQQC
jgi:perosamine synthetase